MASINAISSSIPIEISKGGTNASSFTTSTGIVKYSGTALVESSTAKLDASNIYTNTSQPAFLVSLSTTASNVTGNATTYTVAFATERFDQGNNYNTGTYTFTAPITGRFQFHVGISVDDVTTANAVLGLIVTSNRTYRYAYSSPTAIKSVSDQVAWQFSTITDMDAADTCYVQIQLTGQGADTVSVLGNGSIMITYFSGALVC